MKPSAAFLFKSKWFFFGHCGSRESDVVTFSFPIELNKSFARHYILPILGGDSLIFWGAQLNFKKWSKAIRWRKKTEQEVTVLNEFIGKKYVLLSVNNFYSG